MRVLIATTYTISDIIILCIQIIALNIFTGKKTKPKRFVAAVILATATGMLTRLYYYDCKGNITIPLLVMECFRLCILALFSVKSLNIKDALIAMTVQFLCSMINSSVISLIPDSILNKYSYLNPLLILLVPLFILISFLIIQRKTYKKQKIISEAALSIPTHNYIFMFIAVFLESGLIEILNFNTEKIEIQLTAAKFLSLLLIIIIAALIVSLTVNVIYQKYYNNLNQLLKEQVKLQIQHYEKQEKLNAEIRGFRHDFNNHVKCLKSLMNSERYTEAQSYLDKLTGSMPNYSFLYRTGNYIADAILTEGQETSSADNITINFNGYIPPNIDSTDLCIILSNSINNAIEACQAISGNKLITVYSNVQQGILVLIIKNPTLYSDTAEDIFPETSKDDKVSHGFGLANMQKVVEQYEGTMHTKIENGFFTISFTLKL